MRLVPAILTTSLVLSHAPTTFGQVMYSVQDLGSLSAGTASDYSLASAINAAGQTTGHVGNPAGQWSLAFRVATGGHVSDPGAVFPLIGTYNSMYGAGINDLGQVAGNLYLISSGGATFTHAFRSVANGFGTTVTDLGTLGGSTSSAHAINNLGQVVGNSANAVTGRAFRTSPGGVIDASTDIGNGSAFGINDAGQVTGTAGAHVFRTTPTGTIATADDLGVLPGAVSASGYAINFSGQVAGSASFPDGSEHAFRSTPNGQPPVLLDLGTLPGDNRSRARGINSLGVVVGESDQSAGPFRGFIYDTQMRSLTDLVPPGWTIVEANGINDAGLIAATGSFQGGPYHALVLTPIPEPGSLALLGLGATGLAGRRWKARTRS